MGPDPPRSRRALSPRRGPRGTRGLQFCIRNANLHGHDLPPSDPGTRSRAPPARVPSRPADRTPPVRQDDARPPRVPARPLRLARGAGRPGRGARGSAEVPRRAGPPAPPRRGPARPGDPLVRPGGHRRGPTGEGPVRPHGIPEPADDGEGDPDARRPHGRPGRSSPRSASGWKPPARGSPGRSIARAAPPSHTTPSGSASSAAATPRSPRLPGARRPPWFSAYRQTYLERDVRLVRQVGRPHAVRRLPGHARGPQRHAPQPAAPLARPRHRREHGEGLALGARGLVQVAIVRPWSANLGKRLVKTPKVYVLDTGMLCHLLGFTDPAQAARGPMAGPIFETPRFSRRSRRAPPPRRVAARSLLADVDRARGRLPCRTLRPPRPHRGEGDRHPPPRPRGPHPGPRPRPRGPPRARLGRPPGRPRPPARGRGDRAPAVVPVTWGPDRAGAFAVPRPDGGQEVRRKEQRPRVGLPSVRRKTVSTSGSTANAAPIAS